MSRRLPPSPPRPELDALIKESISRPMSPHEAWQQRVSFAYGNCSLENPRVTREMVERAATEIYGPCPPE